MAGNQKLKDIKKAVTSYYDRYSAKRIALATLIVGFSSLLASLAVYAWLQNGLFAALAGVLCGFIGINVTFLTIVPPAKSLQDAKELICGALDDPSRIKSFSMQKVELTDAKGKVQVLKARELRLWKTQVVPYLIESQASGAVVADAQKPSRKITASERKYIEQRRKEVLEMEKKIEAERESLEKDRSELEARNADLKDAEELVISRLSGIEQAEAELEQLRIVAAERADQEASAGDTQTADAHAAKLQAKEAELVELKERLAKEQISLQSQRAEMERLQKSVSRSPFPGVEVAASGDSLESREAALKARMEELEAEAAALEERASYLTDSENMLIERLDALSHREANIEQSEVNAGIRKD
jgi:hypothetical protein